MLAVPVSGVAVGVVWWLLAPTARVLRTSDGTLLAPAAPELAAAQDSVLVLLLVGAGLVVGAACALHPGPRPVRRSLGVLALAAAGTGLSVATGALLGPAPVRAQLAASPRGPLVSPLRLHSPGGWFVEVAVVAVVLAGAHLLAAWRAAEADTPDDDAAEDAAGPAGPAGPPQDPGASCPTPREPGDRVMPHR